jgi:deazaflavin-dependent oxidoreductase (nitroreductase family)
MVPMLRGPLGSWVGSPVVGYLAVLTTTGRRTGRERHTPLNYAILDGSVYLLAGFGPRTDWLANLRDHPHVLVRLPGRTISGLAEVVDDPDEAIRAAVAVAHNAGFATVFEGLNPVTASDDELSERLAGRPVVRIVALPTTGRRGAEVDTVVTPGRHDPGGRLWLLPHLVAPLAAYTAWRVLRRALRS